MPKIVINTCFGGFGLSEESLEDYKKRKNITDENFYHWDIPRDCPDLVAMVEEGGTDVDGIYSELKVVNVPDDANWFIHEYDGIEYVAERHRTWS